MREAYQIPGLLFTALCHIIVVYNMSEHRYSKKKFVLCSLIYAVIFVNLMGYGFAAGGMRTLLSYIGIVVELLFYSCIVSRDGLPKKCFLFITYFCLFSALDNMLKIMIEVFLPGIPEVAGYYAAIVLRNVFLLLMLLPYKKYAAIIFRSLMDSGKRWWHLTSIALLFYLLQVVLTVLNGVHAMSDRYLFMLFAALSFIMCVEYSVVFSNINYMKKDAEAALIRQNAENLSHCLSVMQSAEETNRRLRHDMRHHIEMIAEYAKSGNTDAILSYIKEYRIEISEAAVKYYSINQTINSIFSVYAAKAEESGIDFLVRCNVPKELKVREIDLIAVLGNLLENALHGCEASEKVKQSIEIHIRLQNGRLIIVCNNTCTDKLKLLDNFPEGKGIGISSILSVCYKYDGNLNYKIEKDICSACAVLNL